MLKVFADRVSCSELNTTGAVVCGRESWLRIRFTLMAGRIDLRSGSHARFLSEIPRTATSGPETHGSGSQ